MIIEIGSYEAKTKLPELLRGIQAGNRYTITRRGEPIAELVPPGLNKATDAAEAVALMQAFINSTADHTPVDIEALIQDGRA